MGTKIYVLNEWAEDESEMWQRGVFTEKALAEAAANKLWENDTDYYDGTSLRFTPGRNYNAPGGVNTEAGRWEIWEYDANTLP